MYPQLIQKLIERLSKFPTVGPRIATRFVFYLLKLSPNELEELVNDIRALSQIKLCKLCYAPNESEIFAICSNTASEAILCVVEKESDVEIIEKTKTHKGYYWVYHAPRDGLVVMDYQRGRSARDGPVSFLVGYKGALQSDGYQAYDDYDRKHKNGDDLYPDVTAYGCMAHARRYYFDAQGNAPDLAEHALKEIGLLYKIERELREGGDSSPENRRRVRLEKAVPILERFKEWIEANRGLPQSPWGKAVHYSLARWEKLCRYTEDGRIEIDNNLVENAIRPIALGRKNYLFAGSHDAAQRAAVIYSLVATCKKNDVNPYEWLKDVLIRIPTHPAKRINELLPHRWEKVKV